MESMKKINCYECNVVLSVREAILLFGSGKREFYCKYCFHKVMKKKVLPKKGFVPWNP